MEGITLVFLAVLAGVVVYLALNLRSFQRVDYSHLVEQEQLRQQIETRITYLEDLIARLAELERTRRDEMDAVLAAAKGELKAEVGQARQKILREVLERPATMDELLLHETTVSQAIPAVADDPQASRRASVARSWREAPSIPQALMTHSPRQQHVTELLELGYTHQDISRILGVSRHEVELVASLLFHEERT